MPKRVRLKVGNWLFLDGAEQQGGSLGLAVQDVLTDQPCLLTAAHVVGALNDRFTHTQVVFANSMGPVPTAAERIGFADRSSPDLTQVLGSTLVCGIDAALVRPADGVTCGRKIGGELHTNGDYYLPLDPALYQLAVRKVGARSGTTTGHIVQVAVRFTASHQNRRITYPFGYLIMSDTDGVPFTLPGDSGSVVTDVWGRLIGLVVAMQDISTGDPSALTFAIPIVWILEALNIRLNGPAWHEP